MNQDGVAYPGWAGEETDRPQPTVTAARCTPPTTCSSRASSARSRSDSFSASQRRSGRSSTTPSTSIASRPRRTRRPGGSGLPARRRPDAGVSSRARRGTLRGARGGARGPSARHRPARLTGRAAAGRARDARAGRARRRIRATRRARADAARSPVAAHQGQGPVPERCDRGDGVRLPGRVPGERGHRRARRRRRGNRRAASRGLGARRALHRQSTGRCSAAVSLPEPAAYAARRALAPSSGSRSSRGSIATPSYSARCSTDASTQISPQPSSGSPMLQPPSASSACNSRACTPPGARDRRSARSPTSWRSGTVQSRSIVGTRMSSRFAPARSRSARKSSTRGRCARGHSRGRRRRLARGLVADGVCLHVRDARMGEALARELEHPAGSSMAMTLAPCVRRCRRPARPCRAHVQHALALRRCARRRIVVPREAVFRVHSSVVLDAPRSTPRYASS